jgi:hypothetical protein
VIQPCIIRVRSIDTHSGLQLSKEEDFEAVLKAEEDYISRVCSDIIALKPDLVITEKGVSDLASHFFLKVCSFVAWTEVSGNRVTSIMQCRLAFLPFEECARWTTCVLGGHAVLPS